MGVSNNYSPTVPSITKCPHPLPGVSPPLTVLKILHKPGSQEHYEFELVCDAKNNPSDTLNK